MIPRKENKKKTHALAMSQLAVVANFSEHQSIRIQYGFLRSGRNFPCEVQNINNLLLTASCPSRHKQEQLFPKVFRFYFQCLELEITSGSMLNKQHAVKQLITVNRGRLKQSEKCA